MSQETASQEIQAHLDQGRQWLQELLNLTGFSTSVSADIVEPLSHEHVEGPSDEEAVAWLTINSSELTAEKVEVLIGEKGEVLDAIQYLASLELNFKAKRGSQRAYVVDIDNYRDRRRQELKQLVNETATAVQTTGRSQEICGLSSAERREIHTLLKAMFPMMETFSRGKEPDRRLVVRPKIEPAAKSDVKDQAVPEDSVTPEENQPETNPESPEE